MHKVSFSLSKVAIHAPRHLLFRLAGLEKLLDIASLSSLKKLFDIAVAVQQHVVAHHQVTCKGEIRQTEPGGQHIPSLVMHVSISITSAPARTA